jgi:hypothetical protein
MTVINSELYRALVEAGASDDAATKAASSVAGYDKQLAAMDTKLERMDGRINTLTYMIGANIAVCLIILGKLLIP